MKVVIIGGVAGGMSAAARLRRLEENAEITVYEMSEHVSYANCGLPYFVSDVISRRDNLLLQTPTALWNRFRIKAKVQSKVVSIDRAAKTVKVHNLATDETYEDTYDKLVISTGARPRHLAIPGIERAMWLRNVTDADEVKAALRKNPALRQQPSQQSAPYQHGRSRRPRPSPGRSDAATLRPRDGRAG